MKWCFAKVNNKLSELYFDKNDKGDIFIIGFASVKRSEFKTKEEQEQIDKDINLYSFQYKDNQYFDNNKQCYVKAVPADFF